MRIILVSQNVGYTGSGIGDFVANISKTNSVKDINDGLKGIQDNFKVNLFINSNDKELLNSKGFSIVSKDVNVFYAIVDAEHISMKPLVRDLKIKNIID